MILNQVQNDWALGVNKLTERESTPANQITGVLYISQKANLLVRLWSYSEVRLHCLVALREQGIGIFVRNRW